MAKPLSETAPELAKAMSEARLNGNGDGKPLRSLQAGRGIGSACTLNYDEISLIFKRFHAKNKGMVQYSGKMMALFDMPSFKTAIKKLIVAYQKFSVVGGREAFQREAMQYTNADKKLHTRDLEECIRHLFDRTGIPFRADEPLVIAKRMTSRDELPHTSDKSGIDTGYISCDDVVNYCAKEFELQEWESVGKRIRQAVQRAYLEGLDVEQLLSDKDVTGSNYISANNFKEFLRDLSAYGPISPDDMQVCLRQFSKRPEQREEKRDPVSLPLFMAFVGKDYVGNLQCRLRLLIEKTPKSQSAKDIVITLNKHCKSAAQQGKASGGKVFYTFDEIESAFSEFAVFTDMSHESFRTVLMKVDTKGGGRVSAYQLLTYLKIPFKQSDLQEGVGRDSGGSSSGAKSLSIDTTVAVQLTIEELLRILLERVQSSGVAVDEAFRHFDTDGDGLITAIELEHGLEKLCVFDNIVDWKSQLPQLVEKFDKSNAGAHDGQVSLKEFFSFLGFEDYAPNIIQRMTKIFALVTQRGLSFQDIFNELDADKDGTINADEIAQGLKNLGTFSEVDLKDAQEVVSYFDKDGDGKISLQEFVEFFSTRVNRVLAERKEKHRQKIGMRFRNVLHGAEKKGATAKDIFSHFDKDEGGSITTQELREGLRAMPHFKQLTDEDVTDLIALLDNDQNGSIDLNEFVAFVDGPNETQSEVSKAVVVVVTFIQRVQDIFKTAAEKGLSFEKIFGLLDTNKDGMVELIEMEACLKRLPHFQELKRDDLVELFRELDADRSGSISIDELREFITYGKVIKDPKSPDSPEGKDATSTPATFAPLTLDASKELFVRHMRRIAEVDGSIRALLAYLDEDGDGLIKETVLKTILTKEGVFDDARLTEYALDKLLVPFVFNHQINVASLLRFLEGGTNSLIIIDNSSGEGKDDDEGMYDSDNIIIMKEYTFSTDPEIHALEKKIRRFGQLLARKGIDVERVFRQRDSDSSGMIRRTEVIEVLSGLGMYILEEGRTLDEETSDSHALRQLQIRQIQQIKGGVYSGGTYLGSAPTMAKSMVASQKGAKDFSDHMESLALVEWYRSSQKQQLLQRVLSHSLASIIKIYPRFGKTVFFEHPITNPFGHEERFQIEVPRDGELRLVTALSEWQYLRLNVRPSVGHLGPEPAEDDMFDNDHTYGTVQVALLPYETVYIPFTYLTFVPYTPPSRKRPPLSYTRASEKSFENAQPGRLEIKGGSYEEKGGGGGGGGKSGEGDGKEDGKEDGKAMENGMEVEEKEEARDTIEVRVISGTHGHLVSVLKIKIYPRPFIVNRTLRFFEPENSIVKRRIQLVGHDNISMYPGEFTAAAKFVHCVEGTHIVRDEESGGKTSLPSRVVVEWGPTYGNNKFAGMGALDLLVRYRCSAFPHTGTFYLLIFNDPYQSRLHEVWQVVIQSRQRLDLHGCVGSTIPTDLVVRGDKYARRARAFASLPLHDHISFKPETVFQLVPGAYNRVAAVVRPCSVGFRRIQINVIDVDSRELISGWIVGVSADAPAVLKTYDVDVLVNKSMHKKILFKNPWDIARRFVLSSSNGGLMKPRSSTVDVAPYGTAYLRLWFCGARQGSGIQEVHLFLNDSQGGQNEECYLFKIRETTEELSDNIYI